MKVYDRINAALNLRKIITGAVVFFILFSVTGFLVLPPVLKSLLTRKLSEQLHREVSIQNIKVNPFALSLTLKGFLIKERREPGTFFSFDELYLNFQSASLVKRGMIFSEIRIDRPYVHIVRNEDLSYNFSDLMEGGSGKKPSDSAPVRFSLNNIQIRNGAVDFHDGPKHTDHTIRDLTIAIPFLSNLSYNVDEYVQPRFEAKINDKPVSFKGMSKPFADSHETSFDVNVKNVDIPYYLAYAPFKMNFKLLSAFLDTKAMVYFTQYRDRAPTIIIDGDIDFRKIALADVRGNPLVSMPVLSFSIASAEVLSGKVHLSSVRLQSPEVNVVRDRAGKVNMLSLVPEGNAVKTVDKNKEGDKKSGKASFVIDVDAVQISEGKVSLADYVPEEGFRTTIEKIEMKVGHFSTQPNKKAAAEITLQTDAGESMKLAGEFSLEPLVSEGTLAIRGIGLKKYAPYYRGMVLFDIEEGEVELSTRVAVAEAEENIDMRLTELGVTLSALRLKKRDDHEDFLRIPALSIKDTSIDLTKKEITIGDLSSERGVMTVKRSAGGELNIGTLTPPTEAAKKGPEPARKGPSERPWLIVLKNIAAEKYAVRVNDLVPSEPVTTTVEQIKLRGSNISSAKNSKGKASISCIVNGKGSVSVGGSVSLVPLSARMDVNIRDFTIVPLQPYFADKVKILVAEGNISAKGTLSLDYSEAAGVKTVYKGEASLSHFSSLDKLNAEDFLKWNSLYLNGIEAGYNPFSVAINEVALTDFYSRLIISSDGTMNVQGIVVQETPKTEAPPAKKETADKAVAVKGKEANPVRVEKVTLQGGTINFSDRHIQPNYNANLLEIGGRISGLSSEETKMADVDLRGKLENYAPLEITGKINPLREDLYVDLKVDFRDMDLSPVTPYSGKYIGYTIEKGKLSLNLQYLIVKKKLDSQNNVFLDQLTLGDKVESPDATKLPVRLAIALLKNRKGEIKLDIPVTGDIDDPKFSVGRIVIKILINLLAKAATSPFALLGAIFGGGGEELSYLDFDYGSSAISEQGEKKLGNLVKALYERPALKLEIEGYVDVEKDREGLRQYIFHKKIKAQKLKEMVRKDLPAVPVDDIKIEEGEYARYLKAAYKEEKFPKPRNLIGMAKDLPVPEMEKLMLTHVEVKDDDLRLLASQRALKVKDVIMKSGKIEQERIFLGEGKTLSPEKKEKMKDSRADFKLK